MPGGATFYIHYLWHCKSFMPLIILAVFSFPLLWEKEKKGTIGILSLAILIPVSIFTLASTKLHWYIYCIFPPLILLASFGADEIVRNSKDWMTGSVCISVPIVMILLCIRTNVQNIRDVGSGNTASVLFSLVSRTDDFVGRRIYKNIIEGDEGWAQSEFLAAELAGDLYPKDGGLETWYTDERAHLFTRMEFLPEIVGDYEIVSEDGTYCILMRY